MIWYSDDDISNAFFFYDLVNFLNCLRSLYNITRKRDSLSGMCESDFFGSVVDSEIIHAKRFYITNMHYSEKNELAKFFSLG